VKTGTLRKLSKSTKLAFVCRAGLHIICQIKIPTGFAEKLVLPKNCFRRKIGFVGRFIYQLPSKAVTHSSNAENIASLVTYIAFKAKVPNPKNNKK